MKTRSHLRSLIKVVTAVFLAVGSANMMAAPMEVNNMSAPIVFELKAELPTPRERIAELISSDYRSLSDEFSKHEYLQKIAPSIERKIKEAGEAESFKVTVNTPLGEYDFERHVFPTGFAPGDYIPFGPYAVRFVNEAEVGHIAVSIEEAKKAVPALKSSRRSTLAFTGKLFKSAEEQLNHRIFKVIYLSVEEIRITVGDSSVQFSADLKERHN